MLQLSVIRGRAGWFLAPIWAAGVLACVTVPAAERPRLLVLTDIGGDPDDQQSLIRLMTYANEFDLEGLIATASGTPGELKESVTKPQLIRDIVEAYGQVRDNLARHADGYPRAEALRQRIKSGNSQRGLPVIGAGHDTEGSGWIIATADRPDPRPLNLSIWGGQTDLAQALWRVREERGAVGLDEFVARLRVYDIGDQDHIAEWMLQEFPNLFYLLARPPAGGDRRDAVYRGMYLGGDESFTSREWMETHLRRDHGPLGALYPTRTWTEPNPHSAIKEGDTPSWFYFLPHGLNDTAHPDWGGWGGRFVQDRARIYRDARDAGGELADVRRSVWRWRPAFQSDFQARMDWCVKPFDAANHPPIALLNRRAGKSVVELDADPGSTVELSAAGSSDPDNHLLTWRWWVYPEASGFAGNVALAGATNAVATVTIPRSAAGRSLHVILEVQDAGTPPLTSFRRAVIHVAASSQKPRIENASALSPREGRVGRAPERGDPAISHPPTPPYPPSLVIRTIHWAPADTIIRRAPGSDNWPLTWGDDDCLYAAYGDGRGFEPFLPRKLSLGLAKIIGEPKAFAGVNLPASTLEQTGDGKAGKKASGLLMVDGALYLWARNAGNAQLAWSADRGTNWTWADWTFTGSFGCPTFLNFGRNYAKARDGFVYVYSHDADSAYDRADRMVLARVPKDRIRQREAYEFFRRLTDDGRPVWTADLRQRGAVFAHAGACYRSSVSFSAGLKRYLWCQTGAGSDTRFAGGFAIYDSPEPWGPWTIAFATAAWDVGPGESMHLPTKWMSPDGRTVWLAFSGNDAFSVRQGTVELQSITK